MHELVQCLQITKPNNINGLRVGGLWVLGLWGIEVGTYAFSEPDFLLSHAVGVDKFLGFPPRNLDVRERGREILEILVLRKLG